MNTLIITIIAALLAFAITMTLLYFKLKRNFNKLLNQKLQPYKKQLAELQQEINRLNFIISELKKNKNPSNANINLNAPNISINDLIAEKQKLEKEKQSLKEKTKKLWEQSLAIHKEKERIDALRRDIERRHKEITDSITYASRIQTALLPKDDFIKSLFKDYFILWLPKNIVSGDFYWFYKHNSKIYAIAADCTGHGVPGAFMSLLGISFLKEIVSLNPNILPDQLLEKMRSAVLESLINPNTNQDYENLPKDGMDMAALLIDTSSNTIFFSGANLPMYLVRNKQLLEFKPVKAPIGYYIVHKNFKLQKINYQPDDIIYIFSDGYADQFGGEKKRKFTYKLFKDLLVEISDLPLNQQKQYLLNAHLQWRDGLEQLDDIMVIGLKPFYSPQNQK